MAMRCLKVLRRLHYVPHNFISTSIVPFQHNFKNFKEYKTEENIVYLEDPDKFGTLSGNFPRSDNINSLEDEGDIKEQQYLQNIPLRSQKLTTRQYAELIKQYVKHKRLKEAINVLEVKMLSEDRVKPENYLYNILIGACADVGYTKKAFKLFNDMKRRALKPTGDTYTCLFHACANSPWPLDGLKNAEHLRAHMIDKGIEPNLTNYNAMIKAFGRCGDLPTAFRIVDEMASKKIRIRVHTFNHLLHACISDKNTGLRHALIVWQKMLNMREKPNIYSFNLMLRCVKESNLGQKEDIEELISSFKDHIIMIENKVHKHLSKPISSELVELNNTKLSIENCDNLINVEDCALTVTQNVNQTGFDDGQSFTAALQFINKPISKAEIRTVPNLLSKNIQMQNVLALKEVRTVQDKFAVLGGQDDFLKEMESYSVKPDVKVFTQMVSLLDDTREAEIKLLETIKQYDVKADIDFYNMLIKKRCLRSDYDGAFEVKQLIEKESKRRNRKNSMKKKHKLKPNVMTYGVLALACNTIERAQQLLCEMEEKQIKVNIEILGALLRQGTAHIQFEYVSYIMDMAKQNNLKANDVFIKHLENFRKRCEKIVQQNTNAKHSEDLVKACEKFLREYKHWIKDVNIDELQTEHPWKQFREPYPEPFQRQNINIEKPKRFYKRNRKFTYYKPRL